jgi:DNA-binding response OmpR family regulator
LLSNAFKFTKEGGWIEVIVTPLPRSRGDKSEPPISPLGEGQRGVNISISDSGRGISPDFIPHIFDRFFQADDNYTKDHEGTGIGLALTKELVELHHGKIAVESKIGKGTTFTIILPSGNEHLKPEEMIVDDLSGDLEESEIMIPVLDDYKKMEIEDAKTGKEKPLLLIVEDNDDLRSYIRSYLIADYRISEAIDGKMGLEKAIEKIPDLVISDVMMPKMDGMEFTRRIKNDERTSHIPAILLTAKAAMEDKLEGLEQGADDFLTKPFDPQELLVRIKNLIQQREKVREKYKGRLIFADRKTEEEFLSADEKFLNKAGEFVRENLADPKLSVEEFAQHMAMSQSQLYRKLKGIIDLSPNEFIRSLRLQRASQLLKKQTGNIAEIAYEVGFSNPSYFSECFRKQFGKLPSEYIE